MPELRGITTVCHLKHSWFWTTTHSIFFNLNVGIIGVDSHARDIYTCFNKGCFGNRALIFESYCLVVTQAKHCIVFCVSMTKSQSNLYWNRCMYGNSHSHGTCVLLEIPSMHKLVQYFQCLYTCRNEDIYELKGVHIANFEADLCTSSVKYCSMSNVNSLYQCS